MRRLANSSRLQAALTVFWLAMIVPALLLGWLHSVSFVSALSLWALVASHGAWWAASKVAEEDVVEEIVERTDVERG